MIFKYNIFSLIFILGCSLINKPLVHKNEKPWDVVILIEVSSSEQIELILKNKNAKITGEWYLNISNRKKIKNIKDLNKKDVETIKRCVFTEGNSTNAYVFISDDSKKKSYCDIEEHILFNELYYFTIRKSAN